MISVTKHSEFSSFIYLLVFLVIFCVGDVMRLICWYNFLKSEISEVFECF